MKKILSICLMLILMVFVTACEKDMDSGPQKLDTKQTLNNDLPDIENKTDYVDTEIDLSGSIEKLAREGNEAALDIIDDEINAELDKKIEEMGDDDEKVNEEVDNSDIDEEIDDLLDSDDEADSDEVDDKELYSGGCLYSYGSFIVGKNLPADMREWEGYHKLGDEVGKVPTRLSFSADGNIKMYTKPLEIEDWELVKNFNVDRIKVPSKDENVDNIIEFPKAVDYCLFEDTLENASKDFPCITLYPEGAPIQANSPFNVELCLQPPGLSLIVKMLNHTFYLSN